MLFDADYLMPKEGRIPGLGGYNQTLLRNERRLHHLSAGGRDASRADGDHADRRIDLVYRLRLLAGGDDRNTG